MRWHDVKMKQREKQRETREYARVGSDRSGFEGDKPERVVKHADADK
jgi:hypothetical protein